jgi:hypothetical protein
MSIVSDSQGGAGVAYTGSSIAVARTRLLSWAGLVIVTMVTATVDRVDLLDLL